MKKQKTYRPSNGTEADLFMDEFCSKCAKNPISINAKKQCNILGRMMSLSTDDKNYPAQLIIINDKPVCTAFKDRKQKNIQRLHRPKKTYGKDLFTNS